MVTLILFFFISLIAFNCAIEINREHHLNIIKNIENGGSDGGGDVVEYSILPSSSNEFSIVKGISEEAIASCYYMPDIDINGWMYLSLSSYSNGGKYNDSYQSRASGYLEGYLTQESILNSKINYYSNNFNSSNEIPEELKKWLIENIEYMNNLISINEDSDYCKQISLTLGQLYGMADGYNEAAGNMDDRLDVLDFFILNMYGDLYDIIPSLGGVGLKPFQKDVNNIEEWFKYSQHCSSSVKVTSDYSELYSGHTTFTPYSTMLRIFKSYNFDLESGTVSKRNLFSSYPGSLTSLDDFYQMADTSLVVMETTNSLVTNDLYHLITPTAGVLSWIRVVVANRMSDSSKLWCEIFQLFNSGTYNNQWIIVDYKLFTPYKELKDGTLYILEQIPGYVEYSDQTVALRLGSWSSYNIPFYETIYNLSGYSNYTGNNYTDSTIYYMSWQTCPRASIFRQRSGQVETLQDFQALMRYNDFKNDKLSHHQPGYAISARYDLSKKDPSPFGGIDSKITSNSLMYINNVVAISGPTTYNEQPVFSWSSWKNKGNKNWTHQGVPDKFNFPWVSFSNTTFRNLK